MEQGQSGELSCITIWGARPLRALGYLVSSRQCLDALASSLEGRGRELTRIVEYIRPCEKQTSPSTRVLE